LAGIVAALLVCGATSAFAETYNFTFDGYCDGMTLKVSDGTYVVGTSTGCNAGYVNEGLMAFVANAPPELGTRAKVAVVSSNSSGAAIALTYVINFSAATWANYYTMNGKTQIQFAAGTLTFVTPEAAPAATGGPSTAPK
jgi:hypothetical protein